MLSLPVKQNKIVKDKFASQVNGNNTKTINVKF